MTARSYAFSHLAFVVSCLLTLGTGSSDRRVVDSVKVGDAQSEALHGYAGDAATSGGLDGLRYRETRGWMHYTLKTFEDTDVTVALTFARADSVSRGYDVFVEDSLIASRTLATADPLQIEISVPFAVTKGKSFVAVVLRARGGVTPRVRELRSIQDHYEVSQLLNLSGVTR